MDSHHSLRIIIYVCVTDIMGNPQRRHITLGDAVCRDILNRKFHPLPQPSGYDHVHIPGDFDSGLPLKRWFIFDLNVREKLSFGDVTRMPHLVFLASRQGDNEWIFIRREKWTEKAKLRTGSYVWGGEMEQKLVSEMRKQTTVRLQNPTHHEASS